MEKIITIFIPVTRTDFLHKTLSCVETQSCKDFKLLVLDDTGYDKDVVNEIFNEHFDESLNKKIIKSEKKLGDGDPTRSWNYGLEYIDTDYFVLLGDDDVLDDNYIEVMMSLINNVPNAPIYRSRVHMIDPHDKIIRYGQLVPNVICWDEYVYEHRMYKLLQSTSEFCINTKLIKDIGGYLSFPYAINSDTATYIALMLKGKMISTNDTFVYWRRHGSNLSMRVPYSKRVSGLEQYHLYVKKLLKDYPHKLDAILVTNVTKVNYIKEKLFVLKNLMYSSLIFRPLILLLCKKNLLKSI